MKTGFVRDLADGQAVVSLFLVREKEVRTSPRTGKSWLQLSLGDRTGTISAKMWDNFDALVTTFDCDDVIHIRGRVKTYNGEKELTIEQIVPAREHDYDLGDFLPHTKYDVEKMYAELHLAVASVRNPWLQQLLASIVDDPEIGPRLKRAPAAMSMHHAYIGGLLEHIVSLLGLANGLSAHYAELDRDMVFTGVVLHDIGKTEELRYARGIDYTTEGRLLGHITIGARIVRKKIDGIPDFPKPLAVLVEHLILSHHGSLEFASPVVPQTREALALHFLDDIDSKMAAARATIEAADSSPAVWTERNPALRRALARPERYLAGAPDQKAEAQPAVKVEVTVKNG
ncbi:MAG TPA: HD domain-containing protein [Candidatus Aquilonibacter sp.]|nr:HD domain-containing protein [Candidatus Aquilonibacter sp.]